MKRYFDNEIQKENDRIDEYIADMYAMLTIIVILGSLTISILSK
jgi:hypothetical protein